MLKNIIIGFLNVVRGWTAPYAYYPAHIRALTFADALWLGSSLGCRAPAPRLGSCVWKTDMRPPVGDSSLKPAWRAEPSADWVSIVFWNKVGKLFSRSCTSWKKIRGWVLYIFICWNDRMKTLLAFSHSAVYGQSLQFIIPQTKRKIKK